MASSDAVMSNSTPSRPTVTLCNKTCSRKKFIIGSSLFIFTFIALCVGIGILVWWFEFRDDGFVDENKVTESETETVIVVRVVNQTAGPNMTAFQVTVLEEEEVEVERTYSWYISGGYALNGHDAVAYRSLSDSDDAISGDKSQYSYEWQGVNWAFSSQENMDLFVDSPESYAPRYGGYCALAMRSGSTVSGDPDAWTVWTDGHLYINANKNARSSWLGGNTDNNIERADEHWSSTGKFSNDNWDNL